MPSGPPPHRHTAVEHDPGNAQRARDRRQNARQDNRNHKNERRKKTLNHEGRWEGCQLRGEGQRNAGVTVCTLGEPSDE